MSFAGFGNVSGVAVDEFSKGNVTYKVTPEGRPVEFVKKQVEVETYGNKTETETTNWITSYTNYSSPAANGTLDIPEACTKSPILSEYQIK